LPGSNWADRLLLRYSIIQSVLTINADTNATVYGGQIDGNIALVKAGTNWIKLNGVNSYTGTTTVNLGTLLIDGTNGSSAVTVNANGTLGGLGTIGGNVTFNSGSHAVFTNGAPLTIAGSLIIATSGTIPDVHLNLPNSGLTAGNYTLATYNATGSSGSFAATPIVDSGSLNGNSATIVTGGGIVELQVTAGGSPVLTNSYAGGVLTLSWPAGWTLQSQTNSLSVGIVTNSANWTDMTGVPNPYNVTPNPANGAVFYRLKQ
jgi:autotransporter-associated beta strand protein